MCQFPSWVVKFNDEVDEVNNIYYLNNDKVKSERGKQLLNYCGGYRSEDVCGHGSIYYFFKLNRCTRSLYQQESEDALVCEIPDVIIKDIVSGKMTKVGHNLEMLNKTGRKIFFNKIKYYADKFDSKINEYVRLLNKKEINQKEYRKLWQKQKEELKINEINLFWKLFKTHANRSWKRQIEKYKRRKL